MSPRRVAATVVTGFLGSGKTTLLRGLLERDPGRERIAVIVNELGEIGIDGRVLSGFEYVENVVELASGCVCCSIDEYRFDLAVDELVRRLDPTLLVLETTGVADPAPAIERLRRCGLGVDAVITVVDAASWSLATRFSRTARRQVEAADFIVISKGDVAGARRVARLRGELARKSPRALVLERNGRDDFEGAELLLATTAAARDRERRREPETEAAAREHSRHLSDDRIESFAWSCDGVVDRAAFEAALAALPREVLRAKGLVETSGTPRAWLFQVVCGRVELTAIEAAAPVSGSRGVFIGRAVLGRRDRIVAALDACRTAAGPRPAQKRG